MLFNWPSPKPKLNREGSTAQNSSARKNCSTPKSQLLDTVRADDIKMKTARKSKKDGFRADACFRPKWSTARIGTARQKHWKMSTARIIRNWKSGTCMTVWL